MAGLSGETGASATKIVKRQEQELAPGLLHLIMVETALVLHYKKKTVRSMSAWVGGRTLFETKKVSKHDKVVSVWHNNWVWRTRKPNKQTKPENVVVFQTRSLVDVCYILKLPVSKIMTRAW